MLNDQYQQFSSRNYKLTRLQQFWVFFWTFLIIIIYKYALQHMKFLVNFSKQIGLQPIQKQLHSNQTVQNLQVIISLNYEDMGKAKLVYKGNTLKDKQKKLRDVFPVFQPQITHQIWVTQKGQMDFVTDLMSKGNGLATTNPILLAGVIIGLIFLILAIVGNMS